MDMCHRLRLLLVKEAETPSVFSFVLPSVYLLVLTLFTTKGTATATTTGHINHCYTTTTPSNISRQYYHSPYSNEISNTLFR